MEFKQERLQLGKVRGVAGDFDFAMIVQHKERKLEVV